MTPKGPLKALDRAFQLVFSNLVVVALFVMVVVVLTLIIGRSVFGVAFFWGEELARYTMIFMAFIGGAVALRADQHPRLTIFTAYLPERARVWIERVLAGLMAVTLAVLFWQGLDVAILDGRMKTPALRIPYFWIFLAVPIGAAAMLIMLFFKQIMPPLIEIDEEADVKEVTE
ncbi:TRAP transporter small permease [Salipiger mucosus]|uniref:TRAP transporter small permease protein n=1 Tax=Salipiger mucosus DSM 16094 TaxID=1123237 RepID=S9R024_9RHOB|nr:TRAP transporter small permease [Salipiger mucosus]EPX85283.1 Tripartite ATP-independent periplasmic transporter, DctQ component [Salipiger mucosus DSM 16094]